MKLFLLSLTAAFASLQLTAQPCNLIQNLDAGLSKVSYQTVFVTVVNNNDRFNIKFWKFAEKLTISCFVITKDTFCVDTSSSVDITFDDGSRFSFVSDKTQNCRGEVDKDFAIDQAPGNDAALATKKVVSIKVTGIRASKTFTPDEKTAASIRSAFKCISEKQMKR